MLKYFQFFVVILTFHELSAGNGLDALINDVFVVKPKGRIDTNKSCECVLYYLCDEKGNIITDGRTAIDIRIDECLDTYEVCCKLENRIEEEKASSLPPPTVKTNKKCGYRNSEGIGYKITGDENGEAEYGEFPWMVGVLNRKQVGNVIAEVYQCGGSLIHPQVVMTAASCVNKIQVENLKVRVGEWDTQTENELFPYYNHEVKEMIVHPDFYKAGFRNNIALLILTKPAEDQPHIDTICLPPQGHVFDGSRCIATGWGKDSQKNGSKYQSILKKIELPIVSHGKCQEMFRRAKNNPGFNLHESSICAGGERGRDTCRGDGGSPLVCPIDGNQGHYYQAGIVSWGIGCGEEGVPGFYSNVAMFRKWIDQQMASKGFDQSKYTIS